MSFKITSNTITPLIVACALFMEHLDGSIIATALPSISHSLHTDPLHLNLAITAYMFSLAIFIPLSGWVADRYGARNVFRAAIIVFTIGSIACGFSINLTTLVFSRCLQGLGGAMMVPVGRLVLLRSIPKSQLVDAMAWVTAPALIGPVLGPPLGGLIVTYTSWRWIFFINIPIGILGIIMASIYISDIRGGTRDPLDIKGFLLMGFALAGLVFSFETLGRHLVAPEFVGLFLCIGIVCLILYKRHIKGHIHPIIDTSVLKYSTFHSSIIGGSLFRISIGALPFLLPLMLQYGFGVTPALSGFITLAGAAGAIVMKIIASPIIRTFGFRSVLISNSLVNVFFLAGCALFTEGTSHFMIFIFLLIGGFFRSLQFTALNTVAFAEIPEALLSRANTLYNMMQQLTLSLGVAIGAALLNLTLMWHNTDNLGAQDFWPAYVGIGLLSLTSIFYFFALHQDAGNEVSGHMRRIDTTPPLP